MYQNLSDQQLFRLNKINKIKDYFVAEIKEIELRLNKYFASFDCFDKSLIVLSVTTGSVFILLFAAVIGVPIGMTSASFSLTFSISKEIVKKVVKNNKK